MSALPFLGISFWLDPPSGHGTERFKVDMKSTSKDALIDNANWVYQRAHSLGLLTRGNVSTPTPLAHQIVADLLASFGWNAGRHKTTKAADRQAWWCGGHVSSADDTGGADNRADTPSLDITVLGHLMRTFQSKEEIKRLMALLKTGSADIIPCQKAPEVGHHVIMSACQHVSG